MVDPTPPPVPDPLATEPAATMGRTPVGNLLAWLGGADWRQIADRSERSAYQLSGVFVALNAVIAGAVLTLAGTGLSRAPIAAVLPYGVLWGLFVGAVDRAVSATITERGTRRAAGGYVARVVLTVLLGFIVGESASMALFRDAIDRTMHNSIQEELTRSRELVVGTPGAPSPRVADKARKEGEVRALDSALRTAQTTYNKNLITLRCAKRPTAGCPPTPPNLDAPGLQRQLLRDGAAVAAAKAKSAALKPGLTRAIGDLQAGIDRDLGEGDRLATKETGIDARWRAMHKFTLSSGDALAIRIIVAGFLVLLDLMPLLFKLFRSQTGHDRRVLELRRRDTEAMAAHAGRRTVRLDSEAAAEAEQRQIQLAVDRERWATDARIEQVVQQRRYELALARLAASPVEAEVGPPTPRPAGPGPDPAGWSGSAGASAGSGPAGRPQSGAPDSDPRPSGSGWPAEVRALVGLRFGRYVATGPLPGADRGAFGLMLLGHDVDDPEDVVVIKAVDPEDDGEDPDGAKSAPRRMWEVEVATARELYPHAAIAQVLASGFDHGYLWTASPRYSPGSLVGWVRAKGDALTLAHTILVVGQVARALGYAHQKNRTHGDLKPHNIALHGSGDVLSAVLLDWGLARAAGQAGLGASRQRPVGTPYYTAPEAFLANTWDRPSADLYSVGATWYYLLTGRAPFQAQAQELGVTRAEAIAQRTFDERLRLSPLPDLLPDLPPEVADLVHQLLSVAPDRRYPAGARAEPAAELAVAVDELQRGLSRGDLELAVGAAAVQAAVARRSAAGPVAYRWPEEQYAPTHREPGTGLALPSGSTDNVVRLRPSAPHGTVPMPGSGATELERGDQWGGNR